MLSPAKINLSLRILSKRSDGFHELETIMVKVPGLADEITITAAANYQLTCSEHTLPVDSRNLISKAHSALEVAARETLPYHIHLEKIIPHGAGLGGGSSNAAITLLALNSQLSTPLTAEKLHSIAAEIGSDVPFFLYEGPARCTGRGEVIHPIAPLPELDLVFFKPQFAVPTADAYSKALDAKPIPGIRYGQQSCDGFSLINDLERPVFAKHRYLAELKKWLSKRRDTHASLMSGSGSTIYSVLQKGADPERLINNALKYFDESLWTWHGKI